MPSKLRTRSGIGRIKNAHWASSGVDPRTDPTVAVVAEATNRVRARPGIPVGNSRQSNGEFGNLSWYQLRSVGKTNSADPTQTCQLGPISASPIKVG